MNLLKRLLLASALVLAGGWAAPAAAEDFKLPDGKAAIHYSRPDGKYDWGLHVWESYQKKEEAGDEWAPKQQNDRPLKNVSWGAPVQPSGKDDFGAYWLLDIAEFDNGRINFIIHSGDRKDCNKDRFWLVKDAKEIWIVSGDCKIYTTKEDALKARK